MIGSLFRLVIHPGSLPGFFPVNRPVVFFYCDLRIKNPFIRKNKIVGCKIRRSGKKILQQRGRHVILVYIIYIQNIIDHFQYRAKLA